MSLRLGDIPQVRGGRSCGKPQRQRRLNRHAETEHQPESLPPEQ
jgi:hypothetical protein